PVHAATTMPNVIAAPTVLNRPPDISPPSFSCKPLQSRMLRTERPDVKRVQRGSEGGRRLSDDQLGGDQHRLRLLIRMLDPPKQHAGGASAYLVLRDPNSC